jgi:hypothetical protein
MMITDTQTNFFLHLNVITEVTATKRFRYQTRGSQRKETKGMREGERMNDGGFRRYLESPVEMTESEGRRLKWILRR